MMRNSAAITGDPLFVELVYEALSPDVSDHPLTEFTANILRSGGPVPMVAAVTIRSTPGGLLFSF